MATRFDFDAFREALQAKRIETWIEFYAEDAEWREFGASAPASRPIAHAGREAIAAFILRVASADVRLTISEEIVTTDWAAFRVDCELADGRRGVEHVMLELRGGLIVRQVDIEAWD